MISNRLLVLDDDPMLGRIISRYAESAGFACLLTTTANQFFERLESWGPTHIVLDLIMPDMDGVEVLGQLALQNCKMPIIIASGVGGRVLDAALRTGKDQGLIISGALSKPFGPAQLRELLLAKPEPIGWTARTATVVDSDDDTDEITAEAFNRALDNKELELVYQPKIDCRNDHLAGFEALVRWNCPERGMLSPDLFIPIAETSGLMGKMTRQVIEQAMTWFSEFLGGLEASNSQESQRIQTIRKLTLPSICRHVHWTIWPS